MSELREQKAAGQGAGRNKRNNWAATMVVAGITLALLVGLIALLGGPAGGPQQAQRPNQGGASGRTAVAQRLLTPAVNPRIHRATPTSAPPPVPAVTSALPATTLVNTIMLTPTLAPPILTPTLVDTPILTPTLAPPMLTPTLQVTDTPLPTALPQILTPTAIYSATLGKFVTATAVGSETPVIVGEIGSKGVIKIGVDLPTSGADASDGLPTRNGVQLAIEQANAAGEIIPGYKLQMYALDDAINGKHDPQQGAANVDQFISDGSVVAMVGPFDANVTISVMPKLNQAGLANISPSNTNPTLTMPQYGKLGIFRPTGKVTYFRVSATDDIQGPAAADYAYDRLGFKKVYVLDDQEAYGQDLANAFVKEFTSKGGDVIDGQTHGVPMVTVDFSSVIGTVAAAKPDFVYYGGTTSNSIGLFRKQMKDKLPGTPLFGGDGIVEGQFITDAGNNANGAYATVVKVDATRLPDARSFIDAYNAHGFRVPLGDYSASAYDATNIIIAAIKQSEANWSSDVNANREAVRAAIAATQGYHGALGNTSFDANGDTTNRLVSIYQVVNGEWQVIDEMRFGGQPGSAYQPAPLPPNTPLLPNTPLPTSTATPPVPIAVPATDTPAPSFASNPNARTTVVLWTKESGDALGWIENTARYFSTSVDKDANIVVIPKTDAEQIKEQFPIALAAANAPTTPDFLWDDGNQIAVFAPGGLIVDMDIAFGAGYNDKFIKPAADGARYNGKSWGVPISVNNYLMLMYNKKLIPTPPQNSDEMISMAKRITRGSGSNAIYGLAYNQGEQFWLNPFLAGFDGWPLINPDNAAKASGTLNTPEMVMSLQFLHDLKFVQKVEPAQADYNSADQLFRDGRAGMIINGDWSISSYLTTSVWPNLDLGIAPIPQIKQTGIWPAPMLAGVYILVATPTVSNPDKMKVVKEFTDYLSSRSVQLDLMRTLWRMPALADAINDPLIAKNQLWSQMAAQVQHAKPQPFVPQMRCAFDAEQMPLQKIMSDNLQAADAAKAMQDSYDACARDLTP